MKFVLVWKSNRLVARTETNSLMIPRDIDSSGTLNLSLDFQGTDPISRILASDILEPLRCSNAVTMVESTAII